MKNQTTAPRRLLAKKTTVDRALLWMTLFFAIGLLLGIWFSQTISQETGQELSLYLADYVATGQGETGQVLWPMVVLYLRYVVVAFFLGFVSLGVVLLPMLTMVYGGLVSFSVCTLVFTFGRPGIVVALAILGVRCWVGIPCYLWMAVQAHRASYGLAQLSLGVKKGTSPVYDGPCYLGFFLCIAVLLIGVFLDLWLAPKWLALAIELVT